MIRSGVDIVKMSRIDSIWQTYGERFVTRLFSDAEQSEMRERTHFIAGRFAAKEAVAKAIGTGVWRRGISFTDIEILRDKSGRPAVYLDGEAKTIFEAEGGRMVSVSISHDGEYAVAFAVAEYMKP
ncbi:MAG TPA: holo-ACP synthase [Fastidiosipila sp.]|nr:holo-ACP synthase [Fastidiosipila sp.]